MVESSDSDEEDDAVKKKRKKSVNWVKKTFDPGDISWIPAPTKSEVPAEPIQYFTKYLPDSTFERLAECSNLYYLRTTGAELGTTPQEIRVFFGIVMYMAVVKFPRIRMYWQQRTRIAVVADAMNLKIFFLSFGPLFISLMRAVQPPTTQINSGRCDLSLMSLGRDAWNLT